MRKILALVCALAFLASCTFSLADGTRVAADEAGVAVTYPDDMICDTTGIFYPYPYVIAEDGIYTLIFNYFALTTDELAGLNENGLSGNLSDEDLILFNDAMVILFVVVGVDSTRSLSDFLAEYDIQGFGEDSFTEICKNGDITYYALTDPDYYTKDRDAIRTEFKEEYTAFQTRMLDVLKEAEYYAPADAE